MANLLLHDGEYQPGSEIEDRIAALEDRISVLEALARTAKRDAVVALLNMLGDSMRHIASGKMEIPETTIQADDKWTTIKMRLAPKLQQAVDVFLLQGPMKRTQVAAALRMDYSNCTKNVIGVLLRQGLLIENGGVLSLKQL